MNFSSEGTSGKVCAALSAVLAAFFLGGVAGWLIGSSEAGTGVSLLASLLTALVALGAYILSPHKPEAIQSEGRNQARSKVCIMSVLTLLFLSGLFMGVKAGQYEKERAHYADKIAKGKERTKKEIEHLEHLADCSYNQRRINLIRDNMGLAPLGSEMFCREHP